MAYADDWGGADPYGQGDARQRLFLMSSLVGMTPVIRRLIPDLVRRRMAFIPTASYAAAYGVANRLMLWWWRALGVDVHVVDLNDARRWRVHDELNNADVFYVCGGNTFYLMHCLQSSGGAGIIRERVTQGVPYLGESAGAVAAAPSIDYIAPMDERPAMAGESAVPTPGLALSAYRVVPHVRGLALGRRAARIMRAHAADPRFVPLRNDQALMVTGMQARVITTRAVLPLAL